MSEPIEKRDARRFAYEYVGAMIICFVLSISTVFGLKAIDPGNLWAMLFLTIPFLGWVLVIVTAIRYYKRMDEMLKAIWAKALAFGALLSQAVFFAYAFAEMYGFPDLGAGIALNISVVCMTLSGVLFSWLQMR